MFGDIGEGTIDETGKCYVYIDDVFAETIDTEVQYQVFLQKYGENERYSPRLSQLEKLAAALDIGIVDLFDSEYKYAPK